MRLDGAFHASSRAWIRCNNEMQPKTPPIYAELARLLADKGTQRINGGVASNRTRALAHETLFGFVRELHAGGKFVQHLRNLDASHALWLVTHWSQRKIAPSTLAQRMTALRKLYRWIGKSDALSSAAEHLASLPDDARRVHYAADKSKAWTEHDIDVPEAIARADRLDARFGLMLRMVAAFGLRRSEVLQCKPWIADRGIALRIFPGEAKGGRPREIPIEKPWQRNILDLVKSNLGKTESMGWAQGAGGRQIQDRARLKYCKGRYARCMRAIGITKDRVGTTGHGLRAEYAENMALIQGVIPPTLGGRGDQMPADELSAKLRHVSENLGHSRESVTSAYYGSFRQTPAPKPIAKARKSTRDSKP